MDTNKVETHFHKSYKSFDAIYEDEGSAMKRIINYLFRRSIILRFDRVIREISPYVGGTVLDVGCGTGRCAVALALKGVKHVDGVDFAGNMVTEASSRSQAIGVDHICSFRQANFIELPETKLYDCVYAMGVLDYIADPVPFVSKMVKVSRKKTMVSFPARGGFIQWVRKQIFRWINNCPVYFYSEKDVREIADKVGATKYAVDRLAKDFFLTIEVEEISGSGV